jgi:hypothetical protein
MRQGSNIGGRGQTAFNAFAGALAGAAAVWMMDRVDWSMYKKEGRLTRMRTKAARPGGLDPAHVAAQRTAKLFGKKLKPSQPNKPGLAIHYGLGIGPAALYSVLIDRFPAVGKGRGALFGLGLFLLQDEALNSAVGLAGRPRKYPWQAHARGLVSHLVYGVALDTGVRTFKKAMHARKQAREVPQEQQVPGTHEIVRPTAPQGETAQHVEH